LLGKPVFDRAKRSEETALALSADSGEKFWNHYDFRISAVVFVRVTSEPNVFMKRGTQMGTQMSEVESGSEQRLLTKKQVAELLQCSLRQVELLTQKGRIAKPVYLGTASPRWQRDELMASLAANQQT
jgi:predicted DNA-binding transcriptional regulator AlpA